VIGTPFYQCAPKTLRDMYEGIAETSGISVAEAVVLDNFLPLVLLGRRAGCASTVAWGKMTSDGTAYMGRNLDFPGFMRDIIAKNGVVVVMNPTGGEHGVAGIGSPGVISGFDDAINSAGLYHEFNNGLGSIEPVLYSNRFPLPSFMRNTLFEYASIDELRLVFNSTRSDYPCLMGVCQPDRGIFFELSPETYVATEASDQITTRANQFLYPEWGIPPLPGKTGWFSTTRQSAFHELIEAKASKINERAFMEAMNMPLYRDDGSLTGSGFSVFHPPSVDPSAQGGGEGGDVTVYQCITHAAERKWWLRVPTHSGWMEIDFKKYFAHA
ncbi:MAG: C45 family autoproteolytic acyltransferase/hydrolase, partial [Pseudomonadota bacterium]